MVYSKQRIALARNLRHTSTMAERLLRSKLRAGRLSGYPFKRQHPFGPYVLDFACVTARLNIELDGSQHADNSADKERDAYLAKAGWTVLRFWNPDVTANMTNILETILATLTEISPSPTLPRFAGEGEKA